MTPLVDTNSVAAEKAEISPGESAPVVFGRAVPQHRRMSFEYGDDFNPLWHERLPELAAAANAVSLMMPHAEPYVAKAVRNAVDGFESERQASNDAEHDAAHPAGDWSEARDYVRQELEHHRQHKAFNDLIMKRYPSVKRLDRVMAFTFERLAERSNGFGLAFAAGFETIAYSGARWTDHRLRRLFGDADPAASTLFLWHLAEEVEHKNVAFDVLRAANVGFFKRLAGMLTAAVLLAAFAMAGTWTLLWAQRRFFSPIAHARLIGWTFSYMFDVLPAMAISLLPSHHPSSLSDPTWFAQWLETYDPETKTIQAWQ